MKLKFTILLCACLFGLQLMAQNPFVLKLIGYFQNPDSSIETDTLYFGFDSLGTEGYQEGLDVIDTLYGINRWHIKDTLTQRQLNTTSPYNSKKSIKAFAYNQRVYWQTHYIGILVGVKYDTTELLYKDGATQFRFAGISCGGCSIDVWENDQLSFGPTIQNGQTFFYNDSIEILEAFNQLNVYIYLKDTLKSGIQEALPDLVVTSPNPVVDFLELQFIKPISGTLNITNLSGQTLISNEINVGEPERLSQIDLTTLKPGCYFVWFHPKDLSLKSTYLKIIKN